MHVEAAGTFRLDCRQAGSNGAVEFIGITSGLPVILEELKKSLLPGVISTNRPLIGQ